MSKIYAVGIAALFATVSIAATTVPASAKDHHKHHHHGHHHGHSGWGGIELDFGSLIPDADDDDDDAQFCLTSYGKIVECDDDDDDD